MVLDTLDAHRLEGARAHMQGHEGRLHALATNGRQQLVIEMQPGGRRRHRSGLLRIDGLIALAIRLIIRAVDIGRQRHVSDALEQRQHRLGEAQLEQGVVARDHLGLATAIDENLRARLGRLARTNVRQHAILIEHTLHQHLQLAAGGLLAEQARRDHAGVVEHHEIAGAQLLQHIGELAMTQLATRAIELQQTAGATLGQRMAGDQRLGEIEVKIGNTHDSAGYFSRAAKLTGFPLVRPREPAARTLQRYAPGYRPPAGPLSPR